MLHTHTHTPPHRHTHTCMCAHTHTHTHTPIDTHTHACAHTHTHTHTRTLTLMHTLKKVILKGAFNRVCVFDQGFPCVLQMGLPSMFFSTHQRRKYASWWMQNRRTFSLPSVVSPWRWWESSTRNAALSSTPTSVIWRWGENSVEQRRRGCLQHLPVLSESKEGIQ